MAEKHDFGSEAEEFAANFLRSKGCCILHRNWRYAHKELDIICTDGTYLIVAEVKARNVGYFPHPEDVLPRSKENYILEASEAYLYKFRVSMPVRFDLLIVIKTRSGMEIEHIENAIIPGLV